MITDTNTDQSYPDHPDRFDVYPQVLCTERVCVDDVTGSWSGVEMCLYQCHIRASGGRDWVMSVCGRCYWELEWSGDVSISVSYKSIRRKGGVECVFGYNDQSWSLICSRSSYSFRHNNIETRLSVKPISSRIGVFVDHGAGTLSFYSVSDTMSLIHTVQTTFTQMLYPGIYVNYGSVKLC